MTSDDVRFNQGEEPLKKPYAAPGFINYGSISEITQQDTTDKKPYFGNDGNLNCTGNAASAPQPCGSS